MLSHEHKKASVLFSRPRWPALAALALCFLFLATAFAQLGPDPAPGAPLLTPRQKAALIKVYGPVDDVMRDSIKRRVDLARKQNCDLIIYEIETYGGLGTSALDISTFTKALGREIPVVAYVHSHAISAGVIIAASCNYIVVSPEAQLGDCMPIQVTMFGGAHAFDPEMRSKVTSPVLSDFKDSADRNHLNYLLLQAMVIREMEVWVIRNNVDVKEPPHYVDGNDKERVLEELNRLPNGGHGNAWILDPKPLDDASSLLTVDSAQALELGLAKARADSELQLRSVCNLRGDLIVLDYLWIEEAVRGLSTDSVRFGLFILMLVLAYIEFSHPGTAIAGIGAIICLLLLVGAPYLTGLAQVWEIIVIVLGAAIIIADLLLYGGVGLLAVPGFILMAIGLIASFVPADPGGGMVPQTPQFYSGLQHGFFVIIFGSLTALGIFYFLSRYLYLTPGFRKLQLAPAIAGPSTGVRDAIDRPATDAVFVGAIGQAVSALRPAGKARFDSFLIDVVSDAQFIPNGTTVVVIRMTGSGIVVKPQPQTQFQTDPSAHPTEPFPPAPPEGTA